jgi:hypothetical protein
MNLNLSGVGPRTVEAFGEDEFLDLMSMAEENAKTDFDLEFLNSLDYKYDEYGAEMFFSEKQEMVLRRIAGEASW